MFALWLRRIHMYAALFLVPWVLIYAISTAFMNHQSHSSDPSETLVFERVSEQIYEGSFPPGASPGQVAAQLLADLDMEGKHRARKPDESGAVVINRDTPLGPRRITYMPQTGKVTVEEATYGTGAFMDQIHRRRGYASNSLKEDAYGFFVDAFIVSMLFWVFSGIWMWWQMKVTRKLGWLSMISGVVLFAFFVVAI